MNPFKLFQASVLAALFLLLSFSAGSRAYAAGEMSGPADFGGNILDGIEDAVKESGIVDFKKQIWDNYGVLIKPFLKSRWALTSNVFKSPDPDKSDNVWEFTPGLQFLKQLNNGVIGGAYEATFRYFQEFDNQNAQDQKFLIYANLNPTENTYIRITEELQQNESISGAPQFETIDATDNRVNLVGGYNLGDFTHELGYENFNKHYATSTAKRYNYNENIFDYRLYYEAFEHVRPWTGYRLGLIDYRQLSSRDTTYMEIPVGVEAHLPYGVFVNASVGWHNRNLHNGDRNDISHAVANISLAKKFNRNRTQVDAGFVRRPEESVFSTATTYDEKLWNVGVKHLITDKLRGRLNTYAGNRDFEERTLVGSRVILGNRVFVIGGTGGAVKRDDDVYGVNVGFDYSVRKWLILNADYQYSRRNSNISALDYTDNTLSLATTIPL